MNKKLIIILSIIFILTLSACNNTEELVYENPKLYPAYTLKENQQLWGYIDEKGKFLVEPRYDTANDFFEGLALVEKDGLFGVLNNDGKEILKPEFTNINKVENGYMTAFKKNEVKIFDYSGVEVELDKKYRNIGVYSDNLFTVLIMDDEENLKFGYIDNNGEEIIKPKYSLAYPFNLGRAIVKENDNFKVIDKKGKVFKNLNYEDIKPSRTGDTYIYSSKGENFGLLNKDGEILIEDKYSVIVEVEDDLVVVGQLKGEIESFGLLNKDGKQILESKYNDIKLLGDGYIAVSSELGLGGRNIYSILNPKLEKISEDKFYNVGGKRGRIENNIISVATDLETYAIDLEGNKVEKVPITSGYGEVCSDRNIVRTMVDGEILYYNIKGEIIWEADKTYTLDSEREIVPKLYQGKGINIKYPHFIGFSDREIQENINKYILNEFTKNAKVNNDEYKYLKTIYEISETGNVIQVDRLDKMLKRNEIEEDVSKNIYNIDLKTGKFYTLKDIFKKDADFVERINHIINEKLLMETDNIGIKKINSVKTDQGFKMEEDKIYLFLKYDDSQEILKGYEVIEIELKELEDIVDYESDYFVKVKK